MKRILYRWVERPFEILLKGPFRFFLGRVFPSPSPLVFYGYERLPSRDGPASGGIVKLQDLSEVFPNCRWRANTLYLISSCYPWTVRWQVMVARFFGARVVLNQNGVAYPAWKPEGWEDENRRSAWVHNRADAVVYQSEFCRRGALEWLQVEECDDSQTLLNPVDLKVFSPRKDGACGNGSVSILLAGTHQFAYRVRVALETLSRLDDRFSMKICGAYSWGDSEEASLEEARQWTETLGVGERVDFCGRYSQSEAPALFQSADVLLHTKVMDPCPRLVAEALASGLPVVYAASGGLPEMVARDAGVGVSSDENFERETPSDPDDFARAVREVSEDLSRYQAGARICAEQRFDRRMWIESHRSVFEGVERTVG
ncbi:MAG: glycosyltransferase family 4 protein [Verrucomicrobiota bacterium]